MTDTDVFRVALTEAVALPGEVRPRPGAAGALRARAQRRHRVSLAAGAAAVPVGLVLVLVIAGLIGGGGSDGRRATTPATTESAASIEPGPRTLSTPIEIRPVVQEYLICPDDTTGLARVPDSDDCLELGPAALTLRRVRDLHEAIRLSPDGSPDDGVSLSVAMTTEDAAAFKTLTTASVGQRLAVVVDGRVWAAPEVAMPISGGGLQIDLDDGPAAELIAALTG